MGCPGSSGTGGIIVSGSSASTAGEFVEGVPKSSRFFSCRDPDFVVLMGMGAEDVELERGEASDLASKVTPPFLPCTVAAGSGRPLPRKLPVRISLGERTEATGCLDEVGNDMIYSSAITFRAEFEKGKSWPVKNYNRRCLLKQMKCSVTALCTTKATQ